MSWIQIISELEAEGRLQREYKAARGRAGKVANIVKVMSLNPEVLSTSMRFYGAVMFGKSGLSRQMRELIATVVSQINGCHY